MLAELPLTPALSLPLASASSTFKGCFVSCCFMFLCCCFLMLPASSSSLEGPENKRPHKGFADKVYRRASVGIASHYQGCLYVSPFMGQKVMLKTTKMGNIGTPGYRGSLKWTWIFPLSSHECYFSGRQGSCLLSFDIKPKTCRRLDGSSKSCYWTTSTSHRLG